MSINFYELSRSTYEEYEIETEKEEEEGYDTSNFSIFNDKLSGLTKGFYIFAGESNGGKTAIMSNLLKDYGTTTKNNLFAIYYTLDDTVGEVIPRIIAMDQNIPIAVAAKPKRYEKLAAITPRTPDEEFNIEKIREQLQRRKQGIQLLKEQSHQFMMTDGTKLHTYEDIVEHAKQAQEFVKSLDDKNNIIIGIDSISDIRYANKDFKDVKNKYECLSEDLKKLANTDLQIPVFGTAHLRKLNHGGRPSLDDLKDSVRLQYDASVTFLVHNDVSKNSNSAKVFYNREGKEEIQPIIEVHWAKNKRSEFKGRTFYYFIPEYSKVTECTLQDSERFNNIIRG